MRLFAKIVDTNLRIVYSSSSENLKLSERDFRFINCQEGMETTLKM